MRFDWGQKLRKTFPLLAPTPHNSRISFPAQGRAAHNFRFSFPPPDPITHNLRISFLEESGTPHRLGFSFPALVLHLSTGQVSRFPRDGRAVPRQTQT